MTEQDEVDAMAKAIVDVIADLKRIPPHKILDISDNGNMPNLDEKFFMFLVYVKHVITEVHRRRKMCCYIGV